jgi:CheY-like chemotaxis protein
MKRILVIDDESAVRLFIRDCLEQSGYFVLEADNGNTGIAAFRQNPVDLVIVDLFMPGKEGIETIIELRKGYPELKILAISGGIPKYGPDNLLYSAQLLGADCCLSKPFTVQQLLDVIEKLLAL